MIHAFWKAWNPALPDQVEKYLKKIKLGVAFLYIFSRNIPSPPPRHFDEVSLVLCLYALVLILRVPKVDMVEWCCSIHASAYIPIELATLIVIAHWGCFMVPKHRPPTVNIILRGYMEVDERTGGEGQKVLSTKSNKWRIQKPRYEWAINLIQLNNVLYLFGLHNTCRMEVNET